MFYTAKKGNKKIIRPLIAVLAIAASFEVANAFTVDADMPAGNIIVEKIDGDFFNVMGLPLCLLGEMLKEQGVELL